VNGNDVVKIGREEENNFHGEKKKHTVASDGGGRGGREGPFGVSKLGRSEQGFDGLVGWARVTQTVKPQNKASRPRHGEGRGISL